MTHLVENIYHFTAHPVTELWLRAYRICATVGAITARSGGISYGGGNGPQCRVSVVAALNTEVCG